jgi:flagellar biogenesis protein FliO
MQLMNAKSKIGVWGSWTAVIVGALVAGMALPQMVPGETSSPQPANVDKTDLRYAAPTLPDVSSPQPMLARLAAGTVIVLLLCVGSLYGMRQWLAPNTLGGSPRTLRLVETLALGNRCSLHLVQFGKNQALVGADAGGIKTIVPLPSPFEELLADAETAE